MGQTTSSRLPQQSGIHPQPQNDDKTYINGHGHIYSLVRGGADRDSQKSQKVKKVKKEKSKEVKKEGIKVKNKTEVCRNIARYDSTKHGLVGEKKQSKCEKDLKHKTDRQEQIRELDESKKEKKEDEKKERSMLPHQAIDTVLHENDKNGNVLRRKRIEKQNSKNRNGNIANLNKQFEDFVTRLRKEAGMPQIADIPKTEKETERSKEAFMDMLASRYPQYAEKISSTASEDGFPVRGRSRDPRRRATVGYSQHNRSMDYEGTLSEADGPTFHRGGFVRSSLPAARSPPSIDKPPGLVFLIFRDETKKALLPNEITHLDTVRAMFVRSFPGKLTMSYLESPKRKIYILEARTNIYYQLEDLRDIKDRTVLRVHECDSEEPQRVQEKPEVRGRTIQIPAGSQGFYGTLPSSAITSQVHQKAQTLPSHMHHPVYMSHDDISQSPARTAYERSRSLTPDPVRSANYAQNPIYGRMGISPERPPPPQDRVGPPDRPLILRTIPENNLMMNGLKNGVEYYDYPDGYGRSSGAPSPRQAHRPSPRQAMSPPAIPSVPRVEPTRRAFSPPPNLQNYDYIQVVPSSQAAHSQGTYIVKGARANTIVTPQRATVAPPATTKTPSSHQPPPGQSQHIPQQSWRERSPVGRHSLPLSAVPYSGSGTVHQRSQSYRVPATSDREPLLVTRPRSMTPSPLDLQEVDTTRDRIDKMEHQLAHLAAWVQTAVVQSSGSTGAPSSVKSLTDIASDGTPTLSQDMKNNILSIKHQADALRSDLRSLRRLQQINKESILETVDDAWRKIREALSSVPGAEHLLIRQQRNEVDVMYKIYLEDKAQAEKELGDLEHAVEELRSDVLSRQCRVQMCDVEGMALVLSHVTKQLGDLKARFPKLQERLKFVMAAEMEVIVREEKFLKEEPEKLDNSLKKCKKLTGTLFTLKRLASVQEHRPPQVVALSAQAKIPTMEDKKAVLQNIQAMIPDHEARLHGIEAAEAARQIKKKITTQQESLRFGKSLELASKALKPYGAAPTSQPGGSSTAVSHQASNGDAHSSSPSQSVADTSSVISFVMPISTSTPKSASQQSTSNTETSATSPSMSYPVMSLIRAVSPRTEQSQSKGQGGGDMRKVKVHEYKGQDEEGRKKEKGSDGRSGRSVDFRSEPAVLPVSSCETAAQKRSGKKSEKSSAVKSSEKPKTTEINNQKSAARAAFFSSLSSPQTPTTATTPTSSVSLSIDSPTEVYSKISPGVNVSPIKSIPSLVRSSAVTMPSASLSASVSQSHASATKPSSLPVSGSSVVSSQRFSPASPSNSSQQTTSRPRTSFTAIPKPYSPTKSTPSPLTPESPRYRIPPSQQTIIYSQPGSGSSRRTQTSQLKQPKDISARPKKVPPPPPPRKSSRVPGHAVLAVNAATVNGQLTKSKHTDSKNLEETSKDRSDIIKPPKQFANIELDTKVERKSSVGSLKQFTTPLLESKRDKSLEKEKSLDKDQKPPEMVGKKFSVSNLDTDDKSTKSIEKDLDLSKEDQNGNHDLEESSRKIIDGKVTNISAEKSSETMRDGSIESTSSSSSLDSQLEAVWVKQKYELADTSSSVTQSSQDTIEDSSVSEEKDKSSENVTFKKPKPPPPERRSSLTSKSRTEADDAADGKDSKGSIDRLV
ncbi:SRC kinase signaling inhibitor 1-like isoform X4 [Mercenaria mercenaria]|uniref:SRC kinase signaling inhibitor 1-like isoform X4 n=1 Tax=Mercenaria mercenaria TaxID=6596 RepID=UPI00234E9CF9|nr:SRC kinase signaling inhibitor 1-like isoform X4 [Mercenaria mercenaria]